MNFSEEPEGMKKSWSALNAKMIQKSSYRFSKLLTVVKRIIANKKLILFLSGSLEFSNYSPLIFMILRGLKYNGSE